MKGKQDVGERKDANRSNNGERTQHRQPTATPTAVQLELVSAPLLSFLQRTAGNAAVAQLLAQRLAVEAPPAPSAAPAAHPAAPGRPTLQSGSQGPLVEELQLKLNVIPAAGAVALNVNGSFDAATQAAVQAFQTAHGLNPDGKVGGHTWPVIIAAARAAETAPLPPHPVLHLNATGAPVGEAQEKLNAAGAAVPLLPVTGVFDATMQNAVNHFQHTNMRLRHPTGTVGPLTWRALDRIAPGGGSRAGRGAMIESHVEVPAGGRPLGPAAAGTSVHDIVGPGGLQQGAAVQELQQKLNHWRHGQGIAPPLAENGTWGAPTQNAVQQFQAAQGIGATGIADVATWRALDIVSPTSTVGYEKREWSENVGGHTYSMMGGSASHYSWSIGPRQMTITAKINFTGQPAPTATWFGFIQNTWNRFKAIKRGGADHVLINFNPVAGAGSDSHTVQVRNPPPPPAPRPRSNAGTFYLGDPNVAQMIPHEFGHLVGLRDEYQLHGPDYVGETGHEAFVGQAAAPAGLTAAAVATALRTAMINRNTQAAFNTSWGAGVRQGAFAQQVVQAYAAMPHGVVPAVPAAPPAPAQPAINLSGDLVNDMDLALPELAANPGIKYSAIETFTYTSGSIMGGSSWNPDPHDHGVQPRHLQEFVDLVQAARGGRWHAVPR